MLILLHFIVNLLNDGSLKLQHFPDFSSNLRCLFPAQRKNVVISIELANEKLA